MSILQRKERQRQKGMNPIISLRATSTARKEQKQQLFRTINTCKELLREPFLPASEMILLYQNGATFQLLQRERILAESFLIMLPTLSTQRTTQLKQITASIQLLLEQKQAIDCLLSTCDYYNKENTNQQLNNLYTQHAVFYNEFSLFCKDMLPLLEELFQNLSYHY